MKLQRVNNLTLIGFILLGTCLAAMPLGAQKYDHSWLLGYLPNDSSERFGGTLLTFGKDTIYTKFQELTFSFNANAQVCDSNGQLKLVTNGCNIYNKYFEQINSQYLGDQNKIVEIYCERNGRGAYPLHQCILLIPSKYDSKIYYMFRNQASNEFKEEATLIWTLKETTPNVFSLSNHDYFIIDEVGNQITATQHGNGMDWWMIIPRVPYGYYISKIDRNGPNEVRLQDINNGPQIEWADNCCGQACFSPDGNTYVSSIYSKGVRIFDFDRCDGMLGNFRLIPLNRDTVSAAGVAISPNNRWLYLSLGDRIIQYDLQSDDIANSGIKVAEYDGHKADLWTTFYQMKLTPNDRILVSSTNTVYEFTQIMNPNERGLACDVQQHSLSLNTRAKQQLPNFPNFRAGRLKGSPCDTLFTTTMLPHTMNPIRVYPNPALDQFEVEVPGGYDRVELLDLHGRLLFSHYQQGPVKVSGLPVGIYTVRVWKNWQVVGVGKVAVMR